MFQEVPLLSTLSKQDRVATSRVQAGALQNRTVELWGFEDVSNDPGTYDLSLSPHRYTLDINLKIGFLLQPKQTQGYRISLGIVSSCPWCFDCKRQVLGQVPIAARQFWKARDFNIATVSSDNLLKLQRNISFLNSDNKKLHFEATDSWEKS